MDLGVPGRGRFRPSFPRRRGDGPDPSHYRGPLREFPPQARGWTRCACARRAGADVSPAGAGMDLHLARRRTGTSGFPRRRGDGPSADYRRWWVYEFPPQARGWTAVDRPQAEADEVSPAGAGMDPSSPGTWAMSCCFPRRRGDGPSPPPSRRTPPRFPPQARGWTCRMAVHVRRMPVSPAGAGMDPARSRARRS